LPDGSYSEAALAEFNVFEKVAFSFSHRLEKLQLHQLRCN